MSRFIDDEAQGDSDGYVSGSDLEPNEEELEAMFAQASNSPDDPGDEDDFLPHGWRNIANELEDDAAAAAYFDRYELEHALEPVAHDGRGHEHVERKEANPAPVHERAGGNQRAAGAASLYRGRHFVFTLHLRGQLADVDDHWLMGMEADMQDKLHDIDYKYVVYQLERGAQAQHGQAANDGLHLQGYIETSRDYRCGQLGGLLGNAHVEKRRGSKQQARDYARKDESRVHGPWEHGEWNPVGQGRRSDLANAVDLLRANDWNLTVVAQELPTTFVRNSTGLQRLVNQLAQPRNWHTHVLVLHGDGGAGKSSMAHAMYPEAYWMPESGTGWVDGYQNQEVVIIDDFDPGVYKANQFLRQADRHPLRSQTKGSFTQWKPKLMVLCHNQAPATWWGMSVNTQALERRLCTVVHVATGPQWNQPVLTVQSRACQCDIFKMNVLSDDHKNTEQGTHYMGCIQ